MSDRRVTTADIIRRLRSQNENLKTDKTALEERVKELEGGIIRLDKKAQEILAIKARSISDKEG